MVTTNTLTVTAYDRRDRSDVLDLFGYSYQRHAHLDWYEPDEWIDAVGGVIRLAWRGSHLVGMIAASLPMDGMAWIRLVAVADGAPETQVLEQLWRSTAAGLRDAGAQSCWVLMLEPWFEYYVPVFGMSEALRLVTLRREGGDLPNVNAPDVTVSPATLDDVAAMTAIDHAAFAPPFQMTAQDMRRAYRFATQSMVARVDGKIAGYQVSTRHGDQGHLARLAVDPAVRGKKTGASLVREMISSFLRRGVDLITVNTQMTNERSLRVYEACGFTRSGYDLPIYRVIL
jgi:ribosomal protein S18 acetylase RimI-like enzyme